MDLVLLDQDGLVWGRKSLTRSHFTPEPGNPGVFTNDSPVSVRVKAAAVTQTRRGAKLTRAALRCNCCGHELAVGLLCQAGTGKPVFVSKNEHVILESGQLAVEGAWCHDS